MHVCKGENLNMDVNPHRCHFGHSNKCTNVFELNPFAKWSRNVNKTFTQKQNLRVCLAYIPLFRD